MNVNEEEISGNQEIFVLEDGISVIVDTSSRKDAPNIGEKIKGPNNQIFTVLGYKITGLGLVFTEDTKGFFRTLSFSDKRGMERLGYVILN